MSKYNNAYSMEVEALLSYQAAEIARLKSLLSQCKEALQAWERLELDEQQCDVVLAAIEKEELNG